MSEVADKSKKLSEFSLAVGVIALICISIIAYFFYSMSQNITTLKGDLSSSTQSLNQKISNLEALLATTTLTSTQLAEQLKNQQNQSNSFQATISDITGTVGTLEKLSKTDKELLQKYSKVYFLSDSYVPMSLADIPSAYLFDQTKIQEFHSSALHFLERMMDQANYDHISLKITSAYRSFGTQSTLKGSYLVTYGSGANKFSADQGYSEHQLGTAVDLTTDGLNPPLDIKLESTSAFTWLTANAYKYGFVLSYPKNNAYYQYEPWHWRFVGYKLATKLHNDGVNFSDMSQRDIDTYLVNIFDY